jgi:ACS family tartrate transporter-like MFS transporter
VFDAAAAVVQSWILAGREFPHTIQVVSDSMKQAVPRPKAALESVHTSAPADDRAIGASAQRKAALRLLPVISIGYGLAYMDRVNISFASLQMNRDLHFSATAYGLGAGLFFIGYALCEVPSNLLLLRFGAKRWLARIMFTWGLLAAAMMFVRTPLEFYTLRFLLGMAEAGFFPGVIYYLTLWFPASTRARAVSRFYIALPLASTVMGSLAGWLLGLNGRLGLAGWQWLFLVEGIPSALFSVVILFALPDGPKHASWLNDREKLWIERTLREEGERAHLGHGAGVMQALLAPQVWLIGLFFFSLLTCNYGYTFSAPAILQAASGWSVSAVGYVVAAIGVCGALGMLLGGTHSDLKGERRWHIVLPCCVMGACSVVASYADQPWVLSASLALAFFAYNAVQGPALSVPTEFLAGRAAAAGIAAMNTITMFSGFVGPYWMGKMKDATGDYRAGLRGLAIPSLAAAAIMLVLTWSLQRTAGTLRYLRKEPAR